MHLETLNMLEIKKHARNKVSTFQRSFKASYLKRCVNHIHVCIFHGKGHIYNYKLVYAYCNKHHRNFQNIT